MLTTNQEPQTATNAPADQLAANTARIRDLNDAMRQSMSRFTLSQGIRALGPVAVLAIVSKVAAFADFSEANDPHGEHDFGAFDYRNEKIFWKIDYYTPDLRSGSPDPADPEVTRRVLTILLASEY